MSKSNANIDRLDFSQIPDDAVEELHRQAEACLSGTVQLAIALDSRAVASSGIFGGGSMLLFAAAITALTGGRIAMAALLFAISSGLFLGAVLCGLAGRATDFFVGGYEPRLLAPAAGPKLNMLKRITEDLQLRITANKRVLERSARYFNSGRWAAVASLPFGILVWWIICCQHPS